eukprot:3592569-Pyramimonas_sp.AAC.2
MKWDDSGSRKAEHGNREVLTFVDVLHQRRWRAQTSRSSVHLWDMQACVTITTMGLKNRITRWVGTVLHYRRNRTPDVPPEELPYSGPSP